MSLSRKLQALGKLIDGNAISGEIRLQLKNRVSQFRKEMCKVPGLAVILVGARTDSAVYVKHKEKAAADIGINFMLNYFPEAVTETEILKCIDDNNKNPEVHGIIVQLPLPSHINTKKVCESVLHTKDVDGLGILNTAKVATRDATGFTPCTPKGCIELLKNNNIVISGKKATVVGRSHIVGLPMALLLNNEDATVSLCHYKTPPELLIKELQQSDIVVVAVGIPEFIRGEWLKPGVVIIDVGINSIPDKTMKSGYRLVGDVNGDEAANIVSYMTPVPGGVGPMTVAMLMTNTVIGFERWNNCKQSQ